MNKFKKAVEPVRKSLLDVVKYNLEVAGKITFITRIAYFGKYSGSLSDLENLFQNNIDNLQTNYTNAPITGLLLIYPKYFIHLLEASEEIIYRHLKLLCDNKNEDYEFGSSNFLPFYHHVHKRFFSDWSHVFTVPPTLIEKLESEDIIEIQRQMSNCFIKLYRLCDHIAKVPRDELVTVEEVLRISEEQAAQFLPESTLLEFLLNAKGLEQLQIKDFMRLNSLVPFVNLYNDSIFPPPRDIMQYTVCKEENFEKKKRTTFEDIPHYHH